ncbi:MAG: helix-turn-helix transcriptional regulator [Bacteroidota bacterium]
MQLLSIYEMLESFLSEFYPDRRVDTAKLEKLITLYNSVQFDDKKIVGLHDDKNRRLFFLSDNFEKITHYQPATFMKGGLLLMLRLLHPSQLSYPFRYHRCFKAFYEKEFVNPPCNLNFYGVGIKLYDGHRKVRTLFLKAKALSFNPQNIAEISVVFLEDISHLVRGNHYWLKIKSDERTLVHVNQKGKKKFDDLISKSELNVLKLIAEKKTNAEIADQLFLSRLTVETHRRNMIKRLDAVDSTALVHLCKMVDII